MPTGRKPKLSVIGGRREHRSATELQARQNNEPKGCDAKFRASSTLSEEAKKEWRRLVKLYRQLEQPVLNDLDLSILAAYCESVAIYQKAQVDYQAPPWNGQLVGKLPGSNVISENPYLKIMTREGQSMAKYAEQLCLSPVGRARMGLAKAQQDQRDDPLTKAGFGDV